MYVCMNMQEVCQLRNFPWVANLNPLNNTTLDVELIVHCYGSMITRIEKIWEWFLSPTFAQVLWSNT